MIWFDDGDDDNDEEEVEVEEEDKPLYKCNYNRDCHLDWAISYLFIHLFSKPMVRGVSIQPQDMTYLYPGWLL